MITLINNGRGRSGKSQDQGLCPVSCPKLTTACASVNIDDVCPVYVINVFHSHIHRHSHETEDELHSLQINVNYYIENVQKIYMISII